MSVLETILEDEEGHALLDGAVQLARTDPDLALTLWRRGDLSGEHRVTLLSVAPVALLGEALSTQLADGEDRVVLQRARMLDPGEDGQLQARGRSLDVPVLLAENDGTSEEVLEELVRGGRAEVAREVSEKRRCSPGLRTRALLSLLEDGGREAALHVAGVLAGRPELCDAVGRELGSEVLEGYPGLEVAAVVLASPLTTDETCAHVVRLATECDEETRERVETAALSRAWIGTGTLDAVGELLSRGERGPKLVTLRAMERERDQAVEALVRAVWYGPAEEVGAALAAGRTHRVESVLNHLATLRDDTPEDVLTPQVLATVGDRAVEDLMERRPSAKILVAAARGAGRHRALRRALTTLSMDARSEAAGACVAAWSRDEEEGRGLEEREWETFLGSQPLPNEVVADLPWRRVQGASAARGLHEGTRRALRELHAAHLHTPEAWEVYAGIVEGFAGTTRELLETAARLAAPK